MRLIACAAIAALPLGAATCESLGGVKLSNTKTTVQTVAAGAFPAPPSGQPGQAPIDFKSLPAFCRVQGVIEPTTDSHIEFELWLPGAAWNGKYRGLGNGGFAGAIDYGGLANSLAYGYAASATDTGHKGGATDATWALGHPEKVADFGYRAIHETAEKAKELVKAYYTNAPRRSYFSSCSNGGREALMEAQRYPADYDGILAGAPANYWTHLLTGAGADLQALNEPGAYIPAAKIPAIQAATLAACDTRDGVKDGVIDDPSRCQFDPGQLLCKDTDSDSCLTAPQAMPQANRFFPAAWWAAKPGLMPGPTGSPAASRIAASCSPSAPSSSATWSTKTPRGIITPSRRTTP
jgi:Tannase and feruloyl esterase